MNRVALLWCAAAISTALACGSTSSETTVGPTPVRCGVALGAPPGTLPHDGGTGTVAVTAARECAWTASTQTSWITLRNPTSGQGDGTVTYAAGANPAALVRRGVVTVGGQSTEVTQQAAPCSFDLDRRQVDLGAAGGSARVEVRAPEGCSWQAASSAAWITITEGASGSGAGAVVFEVAPNGAPAARTGRLTVAGLEVTVRQSAAGGPGPPPPPGDCTFAVEPVVADIGFGETQGTFVVLTDATCGWTAVSDAEWLTIVAGGTGSGGGEVTYRAAENTGATSRTGHITVGDTVFTIAQQGQPQVCEYDIDPVSESFGSSGGSGEFDVDTGLLCAWTAQSQAAWIHITSGSSGLGDGEVDYAVDPNTGEARTGAIRVAGFDFTVSQAANVVTINGDVEDLAGSCPNTTFTVQGQAVRTNAGTSFSGGTCDRRLEEGRRVRVTGIIGGDGVLTASEVRF